MKSFGREIFFSFIQKQLFFFKKKESISVSIFNSSEKFGCGQIKQCKNGHPICSNCATKLSMKNECPQCRSSLDCRSLYLEKILQVIPRPCAFAQLGCKKVLKPNSELDLLHEISCKHGKFPCPFCKTKIVVGQPLNEHVMKKHNYEAESA